MSIEVKNVDTRNERLDIVFPNTTITNIPFEDALNMAKQIRKYAYFSQDVEERFEEMGYNEEALNDPVFNTILDRYAEDREEGYKSWDICLDDAMADYIDYLNQFKE